jgi:hypothetical protein
LQRKEMRQTCQRSNGCRLGEPTQQFPAGKPPADVSIPTHRNRL